MCWCTGEGRANRNGAQGSLKHFSGQARVWDWLRGEVVSDVETAPTLCYSYFEARLPLTLNLSIIEEPKQLDE